MGSRGTREGGVESRNGSEMICQSVVYICLARLSGSARTDGRGTEIGKGHLKFECEDASNLAMELVSVWGAGKGRARLCVRETKIHEWAMYM